MGYARQVYEDSENLLNCHTWVYDGQPYYDSHCFNKDIPAFNFVFHSPLMTEVERINTEMKRKI